MGSKNTVYSLSLTKSEGCLVCRCQGKQPPRSTSPKVRNRATRAVVNVMEKERGGEPPPFLYRSGQLGG